MTKPAHVVLLLIGLVIAMPSTAKERILTLNQQTQATYNDANTHQPEAAVLLIHGWAGSMDEVGDLYKDLATMLAEQHIASVRINVRGEGKRSNYRFTSTLASRVEDAENGLRFLQEQSSAPIGVVGFSMGGATAIALAGKHPKQIDSLVLWSSLVDPDELFSTIASDQTIREAFETGESVVQSFVPITVTKQHVQGLLGYDLLPAFANYSNALMMIRGSDDFIARHEDKVMAISQASPFEYRIIKGADHLFHVFDEAKTYKPTLLNYTQQWLVDTLLETN